MKPIFGFVKWKRRANILLLFSASAAGLLLLIAQLSQSFGDFTIVANNQLVAGLTLSESGTFDSPTVRLKAMPLKDTTNITETDIPSDIDEIDGSHNGNNFLAYTFYLKNTEDVPLLISTQLSITQMLKEVDEAIRIRIYIDGVPTTYAKIGKNGLPEEIAPGVNNNLTVPFQSYNDIINYDSTVIPNQVIKYTVVMWLEGWDDDCVDDIRSGSIQLAMKFTVVEILL